jgi:hypothetical protein
MKVKEFKQIADALSRFATTREKAQGPESLIGVQVSNGTLKLISGTSTAGMAVTVMDFDGEEGRYTFTVPARPFLQASKVLPAKASVRLVVRLDGISLEAEGGGTFDVGKSELSLREVGFPKRPKTARASGGVDATNLKRMSKLFKAVSAKVEVPSVQIVEGTAYATAVAPGNRSQYVSYRFPADGQDGYNMSGYREFWEGLTHFTEDGIMSWAKEGIVVKSGNMECFSAPYLVSKYDPKIGAEPPREAEPWPIMVANDKYDVSFSMDRKDLLTTVKGQAPFDEYNRVTFEVDTDSMRVSPFGTKDGMDLPCEAKGKGIRSVNADYLNGLLNAMDSKVVTIRWSGGVPAISITAEDYSSWTILLAPVTL